MIRHNLGWRETMAMVVILTTAKVFLNLPRAMIERGSTAGWLIVAISTIQGPLIWWAVRGLLRLFPGRTMIGATEAVLGPWFGTVVNLSYAGFFGFLTAVVLRQFGEAMATVFLPQTPLEVIMTVFLGTSVYVAFLGMEAITRTSWMGAAPMLVGMVILLGAGLVTHHEPKALSPFWGTGPLPVISTGLIMNLMGDVLILGLLGPAFRRQRDLEKTAWWSIALCAVVMVSSVIVYLYIFPYPASQRVELPLLQVTRMISLGPGVQRVESLFYIIWTVGGVLKLAVTLNATAAILSEVIRLPSYRHVLFPVALLAFSIGMVPGTLREASRWDEYVRTVGALVTVVLPWLTWIVGLMRRTGRRAASETA